MVEELTPDELEMDDIQLINKITVNMLRNFELDDSVDQMETYDRCMFRHGLKTHHLSCGVSCLLQGKCTNWRWPIWLIICQDVGLCEVCTAHKKLAAGFPNSLKASFPFEKRWNSYQSAYLDEMRLATPISTKLKLPRKCRKIDQMVRNWTKITFFEDFEIPTILV